MCECLCVCVSVCLYPVTYSPCLPPSGHKEYCETDDFAPSCGEDEVIVITHAEYGRMEVNKCVKVSYGYLGCTAKVLPVLDRLCSGRRSCSVRLPHQAMDAMCPCPAEFKTYLNASYMCVKGRSRGQELCSNLCESQCLCLSEETL